MTALRLRKVHLTEIPRAYAWLIWPRAAHACRKRCYTTDPDLDSQIRTKNAISEASLVARRAPAFIVVVAILHACGSSAILSLKSDSPCHAMILSVPVGKKNRAIGVGVAGFLLRSRSSWTNAVRTDFAQAVCGESGKTSPPHFRARFPPYFSSAPPG